MPQAIANAARVWPAHRISHAVFLDVRRLAGRVLFAARAKRCTSFAHAASAWRFSSK